VIHSDAVDQHGLAAMRLIVGGIVGAAVLATSAAIGASWTVAVSLGWCAAAAMVLAWVWASCFPKDAAATARHARAEDLSRRSADLVLLGASTASLIAVAFTLVAAGNTNGAWAQGLLIALAILTVTLSWLAVHTVYTLRYGDLYYSEPAGGIDFNDGEPPAYREFAYLAFTIGMTFQVSDTDLTEKQIRRVVLRHALISYLFGAVIVAVLINAVASLLGH
jgi:uncharacterized membrane protein